MPVANPNPAVHSGGINAVAIATPGITLPFSLVATATIPARPPTKAMNTSYMVGEVRANNSDCTSSSGVKAKYIVAVVTLNTVAMK